MPTTPAPMTAIFIKNPYKPNFLAPATRTLHFGDVPAKQRRATTQVGEEPEAVFIHVKLGGCADGAIDAIHNYPQTGHAKVLMPGNSIYPQLRFADRI